MKKLSFRALADRTASWLHLRVGRLLGSGALVLVVGCTNAPPVTPEGGPHAQAAATWKKRCGACHVPVQPGLRTREVLLVALQRHRTRVRLEEREWAELVAFLAASKEGQTPAMSPSAP